MTKANDIEGISRWLREAQIILRLQDWNIIVSAAPSEQDAWAEIHVHSQRNEAELFLGWDFFKQEPDEQRATLAHELCHVILGRVDQIVERLEEPLGTIAYGLVGTSYDDASERATEHLGRLIARLLPLPKDFK